MTLNTLLRRALFHYRNPTQPGAGKWAAEVDEYFKHANENDARMNAVTPVPPDLPATPSAAALLRSALQFVDRHAQKHPLHQFGSFLNDDLGAHALRDAICAHLGEPPMGMESDWDKKKRIDREEHARKLAANAQQGQGVPRFDLAAQVERFGADSLLPQPARTSSDLRTNPTRMPPAKLEPDDYAIAQSGDADHKFDKIMKRAKEDADIAKERERLEAEPILQFFGYAHLPKHLAHVSIRFYEVANYLVVALPRNPERTVALRKLLEAKETAVRAVLFKS